MASEDSNRSVADYFVVAGLPQKNPQLLDECSLEVNLKNGAYQDPITDIAVRVQHIFFFQKIRQMKAGQCNKYDITKTSGLVQVCFVVTVELLLLYR